ncbi:hypothetical protein [Dyadobacter sp. LHD-138]|uniref:hypothetical protein n=1 Tax=Dyadobacter sp. LHD-138 TaxID=3071413 RepID=UPI0027E00D72|nr:hypothetical protein [Dyadobacter sp. LHD-138]MDQ6481417.1 hypothetical protein [Dyadobacter sp. LHD-138]
MKKYILAALTISFLYACNGAGEKKEGHEGHEHNDEKTPLDAQTQEMLAIHDSIMPHMDQVMNLKKQLGDDIKTTDSLIKIKSTSLLTARKEEAQKLHGQLDSADKAMMGWMHEFKFDTLKSLEKTAAGAYVADQKKKIENVRVLMNKGIADAAQFVEKTKK